MSISFNSSFSSGSVQPSSNARADEARSILNGKDPYEILGVPRGSGIETIKLASRALLLKYHPDKAKQADKSVITELFNKIIYARNTLIQRAENLLIPINKPTIPLSAHLGFTQPFHDFLKDHGMAMMWTSLTNTLRSAQPTLSTSREIVAADEDLRARFAVWEMLHRVYHNPEILCLALTLSWIKSVMDDTESIFLETMKVGYRPKTVMQLYDLAFEIHPLVATDQIKKHIEERTLSERFDAVLNDKETFMSTPVRMAWNYDLNELQKMVIAQLKLSPHIPFLIYDRIKNDAHYIALRFDGTDFTVFSPYEPAFSQSSNALIHLSEEELTGILKDHFYPEDPKVKVSVAITSFMPLPIEMKPKQQALISLGAPGSALIMHEENFMAYILKEYIPNSEQNARLILNSIRDGHLDGLLKEIYLKAPHHFSQPLLLEYIDQAIVQNAWHIPREICSVREEHSSYYLNHYLNESKSLDKLGSIIALFNEKGIILRNFLSETNKFNNTFIDKHIPAILNDSSILIALINIGVLITENQLENLLSAISLALMKKHKNSDQTEAAQRNEGLIVLLTFMVQNQYRFNQVEGLPPRHYLSYALIFSNQDRLFSLWTEQKVISINHLDGEGKYLLNHLSREKKWSTVHFLLGQGALFATGKHVSYKEIPALHAWIENVVELRGLYSQVTPEDWQNLEIEERDVFEVLLTHGKVHPTVMNVIQGVFQESIRENFIPYAFASIYDFDRLQKIIALSGVKKIEKPLKYHFKDYVQEQQLPVEENYRDAGSVPQLIGMNEAEADRVIGRVFNGTVTKWRVKNSAYVYYSCDAAFLADLKNLMLPSCLDLYVKSLMSQLRASSVYLDLGEMIKSVTPLYEEAYKYRIQFNSGSFYQFLEIDPSFSKEKYHASYQSLFSADHPMGIQLKFDHRGRVIDFYCLRHPSVFNLNIDETINVLYQNAEVESAMFLSSAHQLKHIIQDATPLRFSLSPPPHSLEPLFQNIIAKRIKDWDNAHDPFMQFFSRFWGSEKKNEINYENTPYEGDLHGQILLMTSCYHYFKKLLPWHWTRPLMNEEQHELKSALLKMRQYKRHATLLQSGFLADPDLFEEELMAMRRTAGEYGRSMQIALMRNQITDRQLVDIRYTIRKVQDHLALLFTHEVEVDKIRRALAPGEQLTIRRVLCNDQLSFNITRT